VLDRLERWPRQDRYTAWIAKRALRTLIKAGHRRALHLVGAGAKARVRVQEFALSPRKLALGQELALQCRIESTSTAPQRLVIDYVIHYVKKAGGTSPKVFKWKELTLPPRESVILKRSQSIRNFTTRAHYPGHHRVELMANGECIATDSFLLAVPRAQAK
jgi:hypothetical protein